MKEKWIFIGLAILGIAAWIWVMAESARLSCDAGSITQAQGLCLGRRIAELSCIVRDT